MRLQRYLSIRFYPASAAEFLERLIRYCESLAKTPQIGTREPAYGGDVRTIGFERRATIYFRVEPKRILILGIFYRGQLPHV